MEDTLLKCRTCGDDYQDDGEGYDGECPGCVDKADKKLHESK